VPLAKGYPGRNRYSSPSELPVKRWYHSRLWSAHPTSSWLAPRGTSSLASLKFTFAPGASDCAGAFIFQL